MTLHLTLTKRLKMGIKEQLGSRIRELRLKNNLKQSELAEMVNIATKHQSCIETGKNYPALDNFLKMIDVLDLSMKDFGLKGENGLSEQKVYLQKIINTSSEKQLDIYVDMINALQKYF